ncbi:transmembrane protein 68 [Galendromus occidentalis]|uniref:Transmembrane protein 68 n=1 Tax=Galendromus occidentalis TaxID=34638 RepID=A0AAJ6QR06_9ACAR|nr:transmembrane protein 68 [Galendromus occidentalis]
MESSDLKMSLEAQVIAMSYVGLMLLLPVILWTISGRALLSVLAALCGTFSYIYWGTFFCGIIARAARRLDERFQSTAFRRAATWITLSMIRVYGKIVHGYEIHGKENLPKNTGGLLVYHHALIPLDVVYLSADQYFENNRILGGIISRANYAFMRSLCEILEFFTERDRLVDDLKKGHIRSLSPGGQIEATYSQNYELIWSGRVGFAKVAKECGVPVIPMFMVNSEQAMPVKTYGFRERLWRASKPIKKLIHIPLICFPVKLRIFIGEPLLCGKDETPESFAERVKAAINRLRDEHQRRPGSIPIAFLERFGYEPFRREAKKNSL